MLFSDEQLAIVKFCSEECERQRSGERSVSWMVQAWQYAMGRAAEGGMPDEEDVLNLGAIVEPVKNARGYRQQKIFCRRELVGVSIVPGGAKHPPVTQVQFDEGGADWQAIPRLVPALLASMDEYEPEEFFREFEEIHPMIDGNGRVGVCLYNWISGTLLEPTSPPNLWG